MTINERLQKRINMTQICLETTSGLGESEHGVILENQLQIMEAMLVIVKNIKA